MMIRKLNIYIFILLLCCGFGKVDTALAEEISGRRNDLDVTFVVDVSGSMKTNDPDGIALDMVKAFIDSVHIQNIRVGFIAYNDEIVSSSNLVPVMEAAKREGLKDIIDTVDYSGNTDIGLGLMSAYQSMPKDEQRNRIIVLISDGESDLKGSTTGRTLEQSNQELLETVAQCQEEQVPIYTIAFGSYGGSKEVLEQIADNTEAKTYQAESPGLLMEVLYDIFNENLSYKIQKVSTGIYAAGSQEIRCTLDEAYLSEIDILMISSGQIGASEVSYGSQDVPFTRTAYYAVGKIAGEAINQQSKELVVHTTTTDGQLLDIYVISYRNLEPKLILDTELLRNQNYPYQIYFQEMDGSVVKDETFYRNFEWNWGIVSGEPFFDTLPASQVEEGVLSGQLSFSKAGEYHVVGTLSDHLGVYHFKTILTVENTPPTGSLPDLSCVNFSKGGVWNLNDYFQDGDGDELIYTITNSASDLADITLENHVLHLLPLRAGTATIQLQISDGEVTLNSPVTLTVLSFWQVYWWVLVVLLFLVAAILWQVLRRRHPKAGPERIEDIKSKSRFNGRLDLYFTLLPEEAGEIPPLVFSMYKLADSKIRLGNLLREYPEEVEQLGLGQIHLIADEERKMILYHNSDSTIMIGNSIACRQTRYRLSFGDVIYITSDDGAYELELHYIAVIQ